MNAISSGFTTPHHKPLIVNDFSCSGPVDLGEAARRGVGFVVRSGSTKFDRLHTAMTINPRQLSGQDVQMSADMMTANGQFVAKRGGQVDGDLIVGIQTSASTLRVPVRVSGVLPDLVVVGK